MPSTAPGLWTANAGYIGYSGRSDYRNVSEP